MRPVANASASRWSDGCARCWPKLVGMAFEQHGHTHRLDWTDPTLREWDCTVVWSDPSDPEAGIVLDRSAFYPGGGGQPPDHGVLLWQGVQTRIVDTRKGDATGIRDSRLIPAPGDPVP